MKWSDDDTADVPVGVLTVTSTVPDAWEGETAVIEVSELKVKLAATPPKYTTLAPVKPVPLTVTVVPPAVVPEVPVRLVTAGAKLAVTV